MNEAVLRAEKPGDRSQAEGWSMRKNRRLGQRLPRPVLSNFRQGRSAGTVAIRVLQPTS